MKCKAPWTHLRLETDGRIKPCSSFFGEIIDRPLTTIQKDFDGIEFQGFRELQSKGKFIEECKECQIDSELGNPSHRDYWNTKYATVTEPKIRELELCLSNKCNFRCISCNSYFSDRWYDFEIELKTEGVNMDFLHGLAPSKQLNSFFDLEDLDVSELKLLRMIGGEPFLEHRFLHVFEYFKSHGVIGQMELFVNTNNSIWPTKSWFDYINLFDKLTVVLSIDGVGKMGEFIRYGMKFDRFENNLKKWLSYCSENPNRKIAYNILAHNFSILGVFDVIDWIKTIDITVAENVNSGIKDDGISVDLILGPQHMTLQKLPEDTKNIIREKIQDIDSVFATRILDFLDLGVYDNNMMIEYCKFYESLQKRFTVPEKCNIIYQSVKQSLL